MSSPTQKPFGPDRNFFGALHESAEPASHKNGINCESNIMTDPPTRRNGWIQPKFKVSRGTQVVAANIERKMHPVAKSDGQYAKLDMQNIAKNTGPPVPPKPLRRLQTSNKPPLPPKPTLLPKPQLFPKPKQTPTQRTESRCSPVLTNSATPEIPRRPLFCDRASPKSRKSSSLGRIEGKQYRGLLEPELTNQLAYESGYISCSLESLNHALARLSAEMPPKAPPRRRRKSHPEPIYAVVDFSKKRNRRLQLQTETAMETAINAVFDEVSSVVDSGNASNTMSDVSSLTIYTGIDSCDPSVGSQEDLESHRFSETTSLTEIDSVSDAFLDVSNKLNESLQTLDEMVQSIDEALPSPIPVKKRIEFFNTIKETSQSPELSPKSFKYDPPSARLDANNSIKEVLPTRDFRRVSSRSSPTASTVSLCSSDSSDSKPSYPLLQNPCDPDASSIGSIGEIDTSSSTNPSAADSESSTDSKSLSSSKSLEAQVDDAQPACKPENVIESDAPSCESNSVAPSQRPLSRADSRRKIKNRNASFGLCPAALSLPKDSLRRASYESKIEIDVSEMPSHSKSSADCSSNVNNVNPHDVLQGKEKKAYMTAKEIASSERVFVECLGILCDDFRNTVKSKCSEGNVIPESELNKIFSYLPQLYSLNQDLLADFEARVNDWMQNPKIADVIVRKGPFLKIFSAYIRDFQSQSTLWEECIHRYPKFGAIVKQFELEGKCKNLSLRHYMLKPVQRLPQYRLLLDVYLKHLTESSPDYHDTLVALKIVSEVADHANNSIKMEDNFQKLLNLQTRLSEHEIIKPGRLIIKEGDLHKLGRKALQLRHIILLNDSLLYTSYTGSPSPSSGLKLHHALPLDDVEIRESPLAGANQDAYEFSVFSTARSFTLVATTEEQRTAWMNALHEAVNQCKFNKLSFASQDCLRKKECKLGEQAPIWIPDGRVTMCQLCANVFSLTFRRHHCRACGKVICRNCSSQQAPLKYLKNRPARVCDDCFVAIAGESKLIDRSIHRGGRKSIVELAIGTSAISIPSALIADAFDEDKIVCKEPSFDDDSAQKQSRRRNIPPKTVEASATDEESQFSGYLSRRTKRGWKRSWYVLRNLVLYVYKAPEDVLALETISILGHQLQIPESAANETKRNIFKLSHQTSHIIFQADDPTMAKRWIDALYVVTTSSI